MRRGIMVALLALAASTTSWSAERQARVTGVSVISDGEGHHRVLFRSSELAPAGNVVISRAELAVPLAGAASERRLHLALYPVTRAWSEGAVRWSEGWTRPGGDFDEELVSRADVDLRGGEGIARFDVTALVKPWLEGGAEDHGFLLSVSPEFGVGVLTEDLPRLQSLGAAELRLVYRTVEPAPRASRGG